MIDLSHKESQPSQKESQPLHKEASEKKKGNKEGFHKAGEHFGQRQKQTIEIFPSAMNEFIQL